MITRRLSTWYTASAVAISASLNSHCTVVNAFTPSQSNVPVFAGKLFAINERNVDATNAYSNEQTSEKGLSSRSSFLQTVMKDTAIAFAATASTTFISPPRASVAVAAPANRQDKQLNLSDEELKKIITSDMVDRSFLVTADITRSVYSETSTFQDEIDTYPIDKWIKGTQRLFVAEKSKVDLVGDVNVSPKEVTFSFREDLMFRIPLTPVVTLSGKVILTRDEDTGLITTYREIWDQSVGDVLKTAKF